MRVLIVHNQYKFAGGEDTVAESEYKLLADHQNEVYLYTRSNKEIDDMNIFQKLLSVFGTVFSLKSYFEVCKIIRERNIEIVHVHNTVPLISWSVYYAAKKYGCGLVQSIHNFRMVCPCGTMICDGKICDQCLQDGLKCAIKNRCYRNSALQSAVLALAMTINRKLGTFSKVDAYLVTTSFNRDILAHVVPSKNIFYKAYYSDSSVVDIRKKKREYYIYVSRLEKLKGIFTAIHAFEEMPHRKLLVMGVGPEEENAKAYVSEKGITNIEFIGFKDKDEMRRLLFHAKALIFPTQWYEGYPMTIVESMSMGTPIIGSNIGNVGAIIQEGVNGVHFQYDSAKSLREVVSAFESDRDQMLRMEQGSQNIFLSNHAPEKIYQDTIEIYQKALQ